MVRPVSPRSGLLRVVLTAYSSLQKVDNTTTLDAGAARKSVRIHSTEAVKIGSIVIADIIKMPWGCSSASSSLSLVDGGRSRADGERVTQLGRRFG